MTKVIQAVVRHQDRLLYEIDSSIVKALQLKDGTILEQQLTPDGNILLKRA